MPKADPRPGTNVDDDIILATELQERLMLIKRNIEQRDMEAPPEEVLVRETPPSTESIQLQLANRYGVRIPDAQLDAAMARPRAVISLWSSSGLPLSPMARAMGPCARKYAAR